MIKFKKHLSQLNETYNQSQYEKARDWIKSLQLDIRTPKGMKKEHEKLKYILRKVESVEQYFKGKIDDDYGYEIQRSIEEFTKEDLEKINKSFGSKDDKPLEIKRDNITFIKSDAGSYDSFIIAIDDLVEFIKTLKGYHTKCIKDLVVRFVKKTDLKSKALYKTDKDELWINLLSMGNTKEEYGSLRYVVLHELGHRYLKKIPQKWDYDSFEWVTTKYSKVDSFSGEEKFAELFALSHWEEKYPEYKEKIDKFKSIIE